jgi:peroxiredoxin
VLIEECRKLENRTSYAHNEITKENASECDDVGQCQPLSVTDKTPDEATPLLSDSVSDFPVTVHVAKELVSGKADERQVDSLIDASKRAPSPQNQKHGKEMTQKRGVTDHDNNSKSEETNIATNKKAGAVFSSSNRDSDMKDRPSETYTSESLKAGSVSLTANRSNDFEGKSFGAQPSASVSTERKSLSISKKGNKSSDFEDKLSETCNSPCLSANRKSVVISKTGNISSESEDKPSEMHALAVVSTKRKARIANKSSDHNDGPLGAHALALITTKEKERPLSRTNKSSNMEDELSENQMNLYKESDEKTKDEIIQKHLEAARMKLFGCHSPSDDSDFESSNDFGQSETEIKTVSSNDANSEKYRELTKAEQSSTRQEERDTVGNFPNFCITYTDDSNTDTQQMVAPRRQTDEVGPVSRLASMKEKSPCVPTSVCGTQIRRYNTNENVNCEALSCDSKISGDEILSEHDQPTDDLRKLSVSCGNDDAAETKSHTSDSAKNTTLNNKLDEKKHCMITQLKGIGVPTSMPNSRVKESVEQDGETIFTVKTVPDALGPSTSIGNNNPTYFEHGVGAREQLREREDNLLKTAPVIPMNRKNDGETMQTKKNSHLSVEAIAERLTKEKTVVQARPTTQTPVCESQTCEDSNSEDFPALHLSSDDETQSESIHLSQVESKVAKLHGGEETTDDVLTLRSPPRSARDVCRDLELTPTQFRGIESGPKLLQAVDALENEGQQPTCEEQSDTNKCKEVGVPCTSVRTNDCKTLKKGLNPSKRQENTNKKIRALLGNDVSPVKNLTEARKACKGKEREILQKLLTAAEKHNSPIRSPLETELQEKKLEENLRINSAIKRVPENEVLSEQNKVSDSNKTKKGTKSYETCTNEESSSAECRTAALAPCEGPSVEGRSSHATAVTHERHQVSDNETYIEIVYTDDGPKGNSLVFEDICKFSLTFELGEDPDGVAETYKCTVSEFQELFYASPRQCSIESDSYESGQFDIKRKRNSSSCKEDGDLGYVKSSRVRDKELFHKGRGAGLYRREHHTRSRSAGFGRSTDVSHYGMRTSCVLTRSPSPVHRRRALSSSHGRRSQSLDRRSPSSSSPVLSASRMSMFSPLNQLYSEYLRDEMESARFASHSNKGDYNFNFRSREELPFGQRGRRKAKYHDRHIHSKRSLVHSSSREYSHPSSTSSSSSRGISDSYSRMLKHFKEHRPSANKRSLQEGRPIETCSTRLSGDTASLRGVCSGAKDVEKELATSYTQIKDAVDGRRELQDTDESLEEGEVVDEDSMQGLNKYKCNDKLIVQLQNYPSSGNFIRYLVQIAQISW